MITGALREVEARLQDLRRFLTLSELKSRAVKLLLDSSEGKKELSLADEWAVETAAFSAGRTYDYVCSIVLLYGLLERFIEDIAAEYLDALISRTNTFSELPPKLQKWHFESTIAQLQRTRDSRYNGEAGAAQLAESLSACISGKSPVDVLNEPLLFHTSNFRVPVVDDFLNRIGIEQASRRAVQTQVFERYNETQVDKKIVPDDRPEAVWDLVNDLVERRNQVAHGDTSSVFAPSAIVPYCDLVEAYCRALGRVIRDSLAGILAPKLGKCLGHPILVKDHSIVCIESCGLELKPGSLLACNVEGSSWYSLMVESLQIENKAADSTPSGKSVAVGLQTDGRCKKNHMVFSVA